MSWPYQAIITASSSPAVTVRQVNVGSRQMSNPAVIVATTTRPQSAATPFPNSGEAATSTQASGTTSKYLGAGGRDQSSRAKKKITVGRAYPKTGSGRSG